MVKFVYAYKPSVPKGVDEKVLKRNNLLGVPYPLKPPSISESK
jgi:hypothetical protein